MHTFNRSINYLLLFGLLLLAACGGGSTENENSREANESTKIFTYTGGEVSQRLQVKWQNDTAISFVLEHHHGDCNYTLSGDAVNPYFAYDPEQDTDEENGDKFWVDQYLYSREDCRLAIRIAQDTTRARLVVNNCVASSNCQLEYVGVLRREP